MATIDVKDAAGTTQTIERPLAPGRAAAASSKPVALSNEDIAVLGAISDAAWASGNGSLVALLKTIASASLDTTTPSPVSVQTPADVISFTPTLDTSAYAAGDVLFATTSLASVTRVNDGRAVLMSLTGVDKSKQKPAMTLLFYQTNVTSAAANAANNLSDADQANLLGYVRIAAADWIDYNNNSIVCKTSINLLLEAASGAQNVYVVGILDAGTPTFAASDLVFKLGFVQS
jgi:hypothetical protein